MERIKENVLNDFVEMTKNSWTYAKMTTKEQKNLFKTFQDIRTKSCLKGTYNQRWETLQAIYAAFLYGLDYSGWNWREENESEATF